MAASTTFTAASAAARAAARRQEDEAFAGRCHEAEKAIAKRLAGRGRG